MIDRAIKQKEISKLEPDFFKVVCGMLSSASNQFMTIEEEIGAREGRYNAMDRQLNNMVRNHN